MGYMEANVCEKFCRFYKPEQNEPEKCGSYEFLRKNLTKREIVRAADAAPAKPDFSSDDTISEMVCAECAFRVDGCDYRDGVNSTPCGGYAIVSHLLRNSKASP